MNDFARGGHDVSSVSYEEILRANSNVYEWLVGQLGHVNHTKFPERFLKQSATAASFAIQFHAGRFADGELENRLLHLGRELSCTSDVSGTSERLASRISSCRQILHVTTKVFGVGGHTRMMYNWIRFDRTSEHSVAVLEQDSSAVPEWLQAAVLQSGGQMFVFDSNGSHLVRAVRLRQIARCFDLIILHHFPEDVIPSLAFAAEDLPPVAVLDHSDHTFWLGSSIADVGISLRGIAREIGAQRRHIASNIVLPIPIEVSQKLPSRREARRRLHIPEDEMMLLTVGREEKFRPCGPYDYIATAGKILDRNPSAHLYVIGKSAAGITPYLRCEVHNRLHFMGIIENPSIYRSAADVYLETFPFGSCTALLEAGLAGLPLIRTPAPLSPPLVGGSDAIEKVVANPSSEAEYVEQAEAFMRTPVLRTETGLTIREQIIKDHVGEGWEDRLRTVYHLTDGMKHSPRNIPRSECHATDLDVGLSCWSYFRHSMIRYHISLSPTAVHRHHALVAKNAGNYRVARRESWRVLASDFKARSSWRLFATALLGIWGKRLRRGLQYLALPIKSA